MRRIVRNIDLPAVRGDDRAAERKAETKAIAAFFDEHAGYKAFRWSGKTFVAPQGYTLREGAFVWTLKVTIEEEPRP